VVTPTRIETVEPKETVISLIWPDAQVFATSAANVMAKFCHFIFFFASRCSGERWTSNNPGTFLYPLEGAFALATRFNSHNFGTELARRARDGQMRADKI
jgi:alkylmercury lyase